MTELQDYLIRNCRIGYKCERNWGDLVDRGLKNSRYCGDCKQEVVRCVTVKQLKNALAMNSCVAIPVEALGEIPEFLGEISPVYKSS